MILGSIIIFTDGSSRGNPGPGGFGAVIIFPEKNNNSSRINADEARINADGEAMRVVEVGGGEKMTTNNRMEIQAAIRGIESRIKNQESSKERIIIYTDSSYLINGITKWIHGWKQKDWITSTKTPVENRDLWESLDKAVAGKNIEWKYVGGHVGVVGNERCDVIARTFADLTPTDAEKKLNLYNGPLSNYPIKNILDISHDAEKVSAKGESKKRSNMKAYSYVSAIDGKIQTHKTWAECEARVKGKSGARFKKTFNEGEEKMLIEDWGKVS